MAALATDAAPGAWLRLTAAAAAGASLLAVSSACKTPARDRATLTFHYSLLYLALLFVAAAVDATL